MKKIPRYITAEMLKKWGACGKQRRLFRRVFGDSVRVSKRNLLIAAQGGLDIVYFAEQHDIYVFRCCLCDICRPTQQARRQAQAEMIAAVQELWAAIRDHIA